MIDILLLSAYLLPVIALANVVDKYRRLSLLLAIMTLGIVNIRRLWRWFAAALRRLSFSEQLAFDPDKAVHRTAAFLILLTLVNVVFNILIAASPGDVDDLDFVPSAVMLELASTGVMNLAAAFLGVGWLLRRRRTELVQRLCLRMPTLTDVGISIAAGVGLWIFSIGALTIWEQSVPADVFQQQTEYPRLYFEAISSSVFGVLLLAISPAVSEEILFRGALQPVFGVFLTSLFFAVVHLQYGLTPALLILFAVSLGFAWLRLRFHTSAAIIAHGVYNYLPYLLGT